MEHWTYHIKRIGKDLKLKPAVDSIYKWDKCVDIGNYKYNDIESFVELVFMFCGQGRYWKYGEKKAVSQLFSDTVKEFKVKCGEVELILLPNCFEDKVIVKFQKEWCGKYFRLNRNGLMKLMIFMVKPEYECFI